MLTPAPLPTWSNLLHALLRRTPADIDLAVPWRRMGEVAGWLSHSAWSLALIALWRRSLAPTSPLTVWVPDFFCNASLHPLRLTGAQLVFYPLTDDMSPDVDACELLAAGRAPDLLLIVHFFGRPAAAAAVRDFCARRGCWLVEDAAHVLQPVSGVGDSGDFVLYSPHKHLPLPDGAVLVVRTHGPGRLEAAWIASLGAPADWPHRLCELQLRTGRSVGGPPRSAIWLGKRLLQKFAVRHWRRSAPPFAEPLIPAPVDPDVLGSPRLSRVAQRLLPGLISGLGAVAQRRQHNEQLWDALVARTGMSPPGVVLTAERPVDREWTPYMAAYRVDPGAAEAITAQWRELGLPVLTWPDLPPEVTAQRDQHATAWRLRHGRLYLATHQTLEVPAGALQAKLCKSARKKITSAS